MVYRTCTKHAYTFCGSEWPACHKHGMPKYSKYDSHKGRPILDFVEQELELTIPSRAINNPQTDSKCFNSYTKTSSCYQGQPPCINSTVPEL